MADEIVLDFRRGSYCVNADGSPKRRFDTRGAAHVEALRASRLQLDGRLQPYFCSECGGWHIGHGRKGKMSQKGEILKELLSGEAVDSVELADRLKRKDGELRTNPLSVSALVWDLQKQQLVGFDERLSAGHKTPVHIRLTDRGREVATKAEPKEEPKVPTLAVETLGDRIEKVMLDAGPERAWGPTEIAEKLELKQRHAQPAVSSTLSRDKRFVRANQKGIWTLRIWESRFRAPEPPRIAADRTLDNHHNGSVAPGGPVERIRDSQPVAVVVETPANGQLRQNEKPDTGPDYLKGLPAISALMDRAEKHEKLVVAARMLEAAGEEELALQTLAKAELTALEEEVVRLVRRVRGQANDAPDPAHAGVAG